MSTNCGEAWRGLPRAAGQPLLKGPGARRGKSDTEWVWGQEEPQEGPLRLLPRAVRVSSLLSEGEELSGDEPEDEEDSDHAYEGIPK